MCSVKRLPRDPIRFGLLDAFAQFGREEKISLQNPAAADGFVERTRASVLSSLSNEALLHGLRTQFMFEAMTASLGAIEILKQEDSGGIYVSEDKLQVPDFRLILKDGSEMLVEVKNFYQGEDARRPFGLDTDYLEGLTLYANAMKCTLMLAIYWSRWNIWTLVRPEVFENRGETKTVHLEQALMGNQMATLGDYSVGTKFPLTMLMFADKSKPRSVAADGAGTFTISNVELYCAGRLIEEALEKRIATHLMFFGKWNYESEAKVLENQIELVEHRWVPDEDHEQGFEFVDSLSGMFSTYYRFTTQNEGKIENLQLDVSPGSWGRLVPKDYKGKALPLWRFTLEPSVK